MYWCFFLEANFYLVFAVRCIKKNTNLGIPFRLCNSLGWFINDASWPLLSNLLKLLVKNKSKPVGLVGTFIAYSEIMRNQRTLRKAVEISGIGLHSGKRVELTIHPARANEGIVFVRKDLPGSPRIAAHVENVCSTTLATTIGRGDVQVATVEHLMSALYGLGIDNAICEVSADEVPILDGSSAPFVHVIKAVGVHTQRALRKYIVVREAVELRDGDKTAVLRPASDFSISYSIEFSHPIIGKQAFRYDENTSFAKELAPCRTFGFLHDVERMQAMGLALGGSLDNAVVLDKSSVLNPDGLRFSNEFVRHKVLDAIGDLALVGHRLLGSIELHKAGHELQTSLVKTLLENPSAYQIVTVDEAEEESLGLQLVAESALAV